MNELSTIDFYGDEILAYRDEDTGEVFVNIRRICEAVGVNFTGQMKKLRSDSVFSDGLRSRLISTPGGDQNSWFISRKLLQLWLASIQTQRVKPIGRCSGIELP